jgi:hypothetical protein
LERAKEKSVSRELKTELRNALKDAADGRMQIVKSGAGTLDGGLGSVGMRIFLQSLDDLRTAELTLCGKQSERIEACQKALETAKEIEGIQERQVAVGKLYPASLDMATAARLQAEIELQRAHDKPVPKDLKTKRRDVIKERIGAYRKIFEAGAGDILLNLESLYGGSKDLCEAELDLCEKPSERVAAWGKLLEVAKEVEGIEERQFKAKKLSEYVYQRAKAERLNAEIELLREKIKARSADK